MQRLRLRSFKEWLEENDNDGYKASTEVLDIVLANLSADTLTAMLASPECKRLLELYNKFCRNDRGNWPRMKNGENDVHNTIESWVNPFKSRKSTEPRVNIASAVKATDSTTDDLLTAEKKGNAAFVSFVEKRLKSNEIDCYAPLLKSNLQTFGNLVKSWTVKSIATAVVVKADRCVFARMVVIAQHR